MRSYERNRTSLKSPTYKTGLNLPELAEARMTPQGFIQEESGDLRRAQDQLHAQAAALQAQNKELEIYAHMVAHDLKDPLTIMIVTSDLISDVSDLTNQELKEYLQQIRFSAYDMNRIIDNLLLFAEVSKAEAPMEPVDMAGVLANIRKRLSYMIQERQAQIDLPQAWPVAIGYAPWIEEVWANYISNAIKHGGRPPHVELGASAQPDGMLRFWTRDNGPGVPPKARARLFTPFSQIDQVHNPGHGLGLSIVLQIVEKLGGEVGVESELGQGSLFFFTLPADPAGESAYPN
jgi:signal transduction histidine kinase